MHESGVDVIVGLREGSSSWAKAEEAGLRVMTTAEAVIALVCEAMRNRFAVVMA